MSSLRIEFHDGGVHLSQEEQLRLSLSPESTVFEQAGPKAIPVEKEPPAVSATPDQPPALDSFSTFAETCARIGGDSRKLEKIRLLADYLRQLTGDNLGLAATWFTGRPFVASQNKVLQLGWALLRDALCATARVDEVMLHQVYLKHSDLGETAAEILEHHRVKSSLSIARVGEIFKQLNAARGPLAKAPILRDVLAQCAAQEAKYLVKIITGDLRIGLKEGLVEEAIAAAFSRTAEEVRRTNLLVGDIGETAMLAAAGRLGETVLIPFRPVKFMLASPEETAADVWARSQQSLGAPASRRRVPSVEKQRAGETPVLPGPNHGEIAQVPTLWLEDKYDGIRCQLHKVGTPVALYSRDLKDITATFPEIAEQAGRLAPDFILDGELLAMRGDEVLPFAELQKRLGRREDDLFMRDEVPIVFMAFDCLWLSGASLLDRPLRERRAALESLAPLPTGLRRAQVWQGASVTDIEQAFEKARARGNEGLMIKDPGSAYTPGRRGLAWLKLKKALATLDCVVVGAEYGHGKRSQVLSDYTFAVRDEQTGELKTIGKAYTGLTDEEIVGLTGHFLKTAIRRQGRYFEVPPDTVLEIAFDRIQPSGRHNSGLAMRFPRIVRIRPDKTPAEVDTLETARKLVERRKTKEY